MFPDANYPQPQFWLILGAGRVTRGPGLYNQRLEIAAVPLKDGDISLNRHFDPSQMTLQNISITRVPIDLFGLFKIGDVWHRDRPVGAVTFESRNIMVTYRPDWLRFVDAGRTKTNDSKTRWLIPSDRFPLGQLIPHAQLVAVSDGRYHYRYLIPALTLMPFYFGGSSELNRALFRPGFGMPTNPVFSPQETRVEGRDLYLYLLPHIPLEDARVVAPWTTDYGIKQVARIYTSLLLPVEQGVDGYSRTFPPFLGEERLSVQGIQLATGKYARFLILRIESGSLPVPYDRIIVSNPEHAERVRGEPEDGQNEDDESGGGGAGASSERDKTLEIDRNDGPAPGPRATLLLPTAERFRDQPVVQRQKREVPPNPKRPPTAKPDHLPFVLEEPPEEDGALGELGTGGGKKVVVRQVMDASKPATPPKGSRSPVFAAFHEHLDALDPKLDEPHSILVLPELAADDGDSCASFFPLKHGDDNAYFAWYYRQVSRRRRRKLLVALARYKGAWFTLLETEHKPHEEFQMGIISSGVKLPDPDVLTKMAANAAAHHCIWEECTVGSMMLRKQKHTWETAPEFSATMVALFDAMLS